MATKPTTVAKSQALAELSAQIAEMSKRPASGTLLEALRDTTMATIAGTRGVGSSILAAWQIGATTGELAAERTRLTIADRAAARHLAFLESRNQ